MLLFALVRAIEIVGEAAGKVTAETQAELPDLPWSSIVGMRNRLNLGFPNHLVAEVPTEVLGRPHVHTPAIEESRQFCFDVGYVEQAGRRIRLKLHKHIHVAVRPVRASQHRPEQRKAANLVTPAEAGEDFGLDRQPCRHGKALEACKQ